MQIGGSASRCRRGMIRSIIPLVTVIALTVPVARARAAFDIKAMINGVEKVIGKIDASVKDGLAAPSDKNVLEEATFMLGDGFRNLMNNSHGCQFRWFQYVTNDPGSPNWYGKSMDQWTGAKNKPYVDTPYNGWDYERNPANNFSTGVPGGDKSPFYEDDDDFTTGTFPRYSGTYANFNGSAQKVHEDGSADGTSGGIARTQDKPGLSTRGDLTFKTFIVFFDEEAKKNKTFNVLGGFSWGLNRDADGNVKKINVAEAAVDLVEIAAALGVKATYKNAANEDVEVGFGVDGWKAVTGENVQCVPEMSSCAFLLVGLGGTFLVHRRRRLVAGDEAEDPPLAGGRSDRP